MRIFLLSNALWIAATLGAQATPWHYAKEDRSTKQLLVQIDAKSFDQTADGHTKYLHNVTARIYDKGAKTFRAISSREAVVNSESGTFAYGPDLKTVVSLKN